MARFQKSISFSSSRRHSTGPTNDIEATGVLLYRSRTWPKGNDWDVSKDALRSGQIRIARISVLRERLVNCRHAMLNATKAMSQAQKDFQNDRRSLLQFLNDAINMPKKKILTRLTASVARLERLDDDDHVHSVDIEGLQDEQRKLEIELDREESALLHDLQAVTNMHGRSGINDSSMQRLARTRSYGSKSSNMPSVLRDYYDAAGEAGVYFDRKMELSTLYQERLQQREIRVDQGQSLASTDIHLEQNFDNREQQLKAELAQAEQRVSELKYKCEAAGIDPEEHRYRTSSSSERITGQVPAFQGDSIPWRHDPTFDNSGHLESSQRTLVAGPSHGTRLFEDVKSKTTSAVQRWIGNLLPVLTYSRFRPPQHRLQQTTDQFELEPETSSIKSAPGWVIIEKGDAHSNNSITIERPDENVTYLQSIESPADAVDSNRRQLVTRSWHSDSALLPSLKLSRFEFQNINPKERYSDVPEDSRKTTKLRQSNSKVRASALRGVTNWFPAIPPLPF